MISDVEPLFMCLLAIYISSLEKYLFRCCAYMQINILNDNAKLLLSCSSWHYKMAYQWSGSNQDNACGPLSKGIKATLKMFF